MVSSGAVYVKCRYTEDLVKKKKEKLVEADVFVIFADCCCSRCLLHQLSQAVGCHVM